LARFLWIYPAIYLPRLLMPTLRRKDPYPIWQRPFILSFTGVRGIVSLAAALALPLMTAAGEPFPHRDLILLLTFWVILVTLVGQGLLLPAVIGWLGLPKVAETEQSRSARPSSPRAGPPSTPSCRRSIGWRENAPAGGCGKRHSGAVHRASQASRIG